MKTTFPLLFLLGFSLPCLATITITTTTLPNGTVSTAYSAVIKASGGCTPYSWSILSGTLPAGVSSKPSTTTTALDLSGTPTKAASFSFTVLAMGCGKHTSRQSYTVVIQSGANHVVDLNWKASISTDVAGYNVYRSPDGSTWKKINASLVASTLYNDATVANGSTYYYATTAVDTHGNESVKTPSVEVVIP